MNKRGKQITTVPPSPDFPAVGSLVVFNPTAIKSYEVYGGLESRKEYLTCEILGFDAATLTAAEFIDGCLVAGCQEGEECVGRGWIESWNKKLFFDEPVVLVDVCWEVDASFSDYKLVAVKLLHPTAGLRFANFHLTEGPVLTKVNCDDDDE